MGFCGIRPMENSQDVLVNVIRNMYEITFLKILSRLKGANELTCTTFSNEDDLILPPVVNT